VEDKVEELHQLVKDNEKNTKKMWMKYSRPQRHHQMTKCVNDGYTRRRDTY
jgi:hypothetical protein